MEEQVHKKKTRHMIGPTSLKIHHWKIWEEKWRYGKIDHIKRQMNQFYRM